MPQKYYYATMGKTILLYGKSVFIAGLASILEKSPDLKIIKGENLDFSEATYPNLILADLCDVETIRALSKLFALHAPLVGIEPSASVVTVLSGESHSAQSVQELMAALMEIIQRSASVLPTDSEDPKQSEESAVSTEGVNVACDDKL